MKNLIEKFASVEESRMDIEQTWKVLESAKGDLFRGEAVRALESVGRSSEKAEAKVFAKKMADELNRFRKLIDEYLHNNTGLERKPPKV